MQRIIGKISFGFSIFLLFHSYNSFEVFAQAHDARALKGLRGIYVVVDKIPSEFQKKIGEEQIKKDIELKLRTAGVNYYRLKAVALPVGCKPTKVHPLP